MACFLQDRAPSHPRGSGNTRDCPPQMRFWKVVVAIGGAPHVCSISDGLSHSPGSQQIRGFACFWLCRAHLLCIFFLQRFSSLTCLQICLRAHGGREEGGGVGRRRKTLRKRLGRRALPEGRCPQSWMRETVMSPLEMGKQWGQVLLSVLGAAGSEGPSPPRLDKTRPGSVAGTLPTWHVVSASGDPSQSLS